MAFLSDLQTLYSVAKALYDIRQELIVNQEDLARLLDRCRDFASYIEQLKALKNPNELPSATQASVVRLSQLFKEVTRVHQKSQSSSVFSTAKRLFSSKSSHEKIFELNRRLNDLVTELQIGKQIDVERKVDDIVAANQEILLQLRAIAESRSNNMDDMFELEPPPKHRHDFSAELGSGAFGTVFRMKNKHDGHIYAVKEIRVQRANDALIDLSSVQKEVDIMIQLMHPNIVRYFISFYSAQQTLFNVVMEYADFGTLAPQVTVDPSPASETVTRWLSECLSALSYMHSQPFLHRDIKPENILLKRVNHNQRGMTQIIKIADLGLATVVSSSVTL